MDTITLHIEGVLVPVTNLFDQYGNDCESWEQAERFVAGPFPDGTWLSDSCAEYTVSRRQ